MSSAVTVDSSPLTKIEQTKEKDGKKGPPTAGNIKVLCRFRPFNQKEIENAK